MKSTETSFNASDGKSIHLYRWEPEKKPGALLLLAHGMGEHAGRYDRLARFLTDAGWVVWAPDHRGHGKTASEDELGWFAHEDGLTLVMEDTHEIAGKMVAEYQGLPLFLLGHSMGSFIAQGFASRYGGMLAGLVLSGTAGPMGPIRGLGLMLARIGSRIYGEKSQTPFLDRLSFGAFNKAFAPARTNFDWLSRDEKEVDAYIADKRCGFIASFGLFRDLLSGLGWMQSGKAIKGIPRDLPIYMFAGDNDPVGKSGKSFMKLAALYRKAGIKRLETRLYSDGRHESLNETNRDEVMNELLAWLDAVLTSAPQ